MNITEETIKGAIALTKVKCDLIKKGFVPLTSEIEQLVFDLVGFNSINNTFTKFQIKYNGTDRIRLKNTKFNYRTKILSKYKKYDFDFYAIYVPSKDIVLYVPFFLGGKNISFKINDSGKPFNWWEDFLEIKNHDNYKRKTCVDFGIPIKKYGGPTDLGTSRKDAL